MFDLIIRNGIVYDGESILPKQVDIGIVADRIVELSDLCSVSAGRVLDASGLCVAPGFIDIHNHASNEMDGGILNIPTADNMVRQGVTSLVSGNCGGSPWPIGQHLEAISSCGMRQNYGLLIGYNTVRGQVLKQSQTPTKAQVDAIRDLVRKGVEEGAFGVSSGYMSAMVTAPEIASTLQALEGTDLVYASHIRSEGAGCLEAIDELLEVGRRRGISLQLTHL